MKGEFQPLKISVSVSAVVPASHLTFSSAVACILQVTYGFIKPSFLHLIDGGKLTLISKKGLILLPRLVFRHQPSLIF